MFFIGIVSQDTSLSHAVSEQLKQSGNDCPHALFPSLEEALVAWGEAFPPLIFWDAVSASSPEDVASFFVSRLEQTKPAPLVLVFGDPPPALSVFGVTEVFARPLRLGYLMARIQFYQRLLRQAPDVALSLGPWIFQPREKSVTHKENGTTLKLTDKESVLLEFLCSSPEPVSRDELLASVWGYEADIDTHTLETHIYRLRRKLSQSEDQAGDVFASGPGGYQINPAWRGGA